MAELQLTLRYNTLPSKIGVTAMTVLFPVWALALPCALGYFIGNTLRDPSAVSAATIIITWCQYLAAILSCIFLTAVAEDNKFRVTKDGIRIPLYMIPRLGFKRNLHWEDVKHATVAGEQNQSLMLSMRNGKSMTLQTSALQSSELEQLLMAIELWSSNCERSPQLIAFQRETQNQGRATGGVGYTQMWEEELSRRFSATTFMPLEPGKELKGGKLKVVRQLAFGGLSAIYLAQQDGRDLVVLKESVVPATADAATRRSAEEHLAREASLLSQLHHDHIARVYDHFVEDGRHYILMEYIQGQDLRQYIKQNGPVDEAKAVQWGLTIANILAYLHGQNPPIVHRDLTPDNIVLTNDGKLVLIDFGAANQFVGSATGTIVGKQAYIPAEQLRGKTVPQSDIYALAGTIQFLLSGKDPKPLANCNVRQYRPDVSEGLQNLLQKCTEFEPEQRPQTADEVISALTALQHEEGANLSLSVAEHS